MFIWIWFKIIFSLLLNQLLQICYIQNNLKRNPFYPFKIIYFTKSNVPIIG